MNVAILLSATLRMPVLLS